MSNETLVLLRAVVLMDFALAEYTGLKELERKLVTYWTLGTHALPQLNTYPLLILMGKMGTGKSQTLHVIKNFARKPRMFNMRGSTLPVIRDEFAQAQGGTAIVEEADYAWKDAEVFERMLSDRYQESSAKAAHKVKVGRDDWETETKHYFGATVLHRRIPFNDAALNGRSIVVRFRADTTRQYAEYNDYAESVVEGKHLLRNFGVVLPYVEPLKGVAARIFNTHKVLLSIAELCGDEEFSNQIRERLLLATAELKEAQSIEPDALVVRAIIEAISTDSGFQFRNVKISVLVDSIFRHHKVNLQPQQVGGLARELGFETKNSHGVRVVVPTAMTLLKACEQCGYEDEAIIELRRQIIDVDG